ncbi:hypothetical protein ABMA28_015116 [Loxostege sticticalis]|uniref:Uncharacterized protein n=1 Tax=Loxostege sticticalis TaxID=481309 RepID=A0ABD0TED3_LOXSC
MDRRRNRRGRGHSHSQRNLPHIFSPPEESKRWSFLGGLYSFVIMTSLIALIYMMLEYHCSNCKENKCDMNNVTKSIDDIAKNLSIIKDSYYDLELKISRFSQDLPKLEGQIDILEALANTMEKSHLGWDPKSQLSLPNVDVYLNKQMEKNISKCSTCVPNNMKVKQD